MYRFRFATWVVNLKNAKTKNFRFFVFESVHSNGGWSSSMVLHRIRLINRYLTFAIIINYVFVCVDLFVFFGMERTSGQHCCKWYQIFYQITNNESGSMRNHKIDTIGTWMLIVCQSMAAHHQLDTFLSIFKMQHTDSFELRANDKPKENKWKNKRND